jgi:hypothetical protein
MFYICQCTMVVMICVLCYVHFCFFNLVAYEKFLCGQKPTCTSFMPLVPRIQFSPWQRKLKLSNFSQEVEHFKRGLAYR